MSYELIKPEFSHLRLWDAANARIDYVDIENYHSDEQETVLMHSRKDEYYFIDCSETGQLLKLARNPSVSVFHMTLAPSGKILRIRATIPPNKISYRK